MKGFWDYTIYTYENIWRWFFLNFDVEATPDLPFFVVFFQLRFTERLLYTPIVCTALPFSSDVFDQQLGEAPRIDCRLLMTNDGGKFITTRCGFFFKPEYLNDVKRILGMLASKLSKPPTKSKKRPPAIQGGKRNVSGKQKPPFVWADPPAAVSEGEGMQSDLDEEPFSEVRTWESSNIQNILLEQCLIWS